MQKGFTLFEIIIALLLLSLIFSFVIPTSYSLYLHYIETQKLEKIVLFLHSIKREAFLNNKEYVLSERDNQLYLNNEKIDKFQLRFEIETPIRFFKSGTTSGGTIFVYLDKNCYKIILLPPFGEITYEKKQGNYSY